MTIYLDGQRIDLRRTYYFFIPERQQRCRARGIHELEDPIKDHLWISETHPSTLRRGKETTGIGNLYGPMINDDEIAKRLGFSWSGSRERR